MICTYFLHTVKIVDLILMTFRDVKVAFCDMFLIEFALSMVMQTCQGQLLRLISTLHDHTCDEPCLEIAIID